VADGAWESGGGGGGGGVEDRLEQEGLFVFR